MDLINREKALGCFWVYEDGDETNMPAYDRLQALPIVKEVDDCISRQDAIDGADEIIKRDTSGNNAVVEAMKAWKVYIGNLPSAQPVQKTGQWIKRKKGAIGYNCSCCGKSDISNHFDYCPNCGADMRGGKDG